MKFHIDIEALLKLSPDLAMKLEFLLCDILAVKDEEGKSTILVTILPDTAEKT